MASPRTRTASFVWIAAAYLFALSAAVATAWWLNHAGKPLWLVVLAADVVGTIVVFGFSVALDNSSVYDPYWSVGPMVIAPALALFASSSSIPPIRKWLVVALVLLWGARLTWNWARGWNGLSHEDWRYADMRPKARRLYWVVSFLGFHLMPTIWVYLGCFSLLTALCTGTAPLGPLDLAGFIVTASAIWIEAKADRQLRDFRLAGPKPGEIMATGLWRHCRHPNYLGEISLWWGLFLFGLASDATSWKNIVGPISINALFVLISIPLIDKHNTARRAGYPEHMRRVPALLPRPWRRSDPAEAASRTP